MVNPKFKQNFTIVATGDNIMLPARIDNILTQFWIAYIFCSTKFKWKKNTFYSVDHFTCENNILSFLSTLVFFGAIFFCYLQFPFPSNLTSSWLSILSHSGDGTPAQYLHRTWQKLQRMSSHDPSRNGKPFQNPQSDCTSLFYCLLRTIMHSKF